MMTSHTGTASPASVAKAGKEAIHPLKESFPPTVLIGATLSIATLRGEDALGESIAREHFNALTAENSMKPALVQPQEGHFNFAEGDRLIEMAQECGAAVVGHTLVWHQQTPQWFWEDESGGVASPELALRHMRQHIEAVVGRYRGKVREWDVVNEAISDAPDEFLRPSRWLEVLGEDFIAQGFRAAHEADPNALLIYNDYSNEIGDKHQKTLRLLRSLLDAGVPIHGVGIQAHWQLGYPDLEEVEQAIINFAALGLKVRITELDVSVLPRAHHGADIEFQEHQAEGMNPFTEGLPPEVGEQLAQRYKKIFELFLRHQEAIGRVSLWGVYDGRTWLDNFPMRGRTDHPLLFDRQGKPKAAFFAVERVAQEASAIASNR